MSLNELSFEAAAPEWFQVQGFAVGRSPQLISSEIAPERDSAGDVVLLDHLREAIRKKNSAPIPYRQQ